MRGGAVAGATGRFAPDLERQYSVWVAGRVRPLAVAVAVMSATVWTVLPVATSVFLGRPAPAVIWWVCFGINAPASLGFLLLARRPDRPGLPAGFVIAVLAVAAGSFINPLATEFRDNAPGLMVGNAIFYSMVCVFARIPVRLTALTTVVTTTAAIVTMALMIRNGSVTAHATWFYWVLLSGAAVVAIGSAWAGEQAMRRQFSDERLIAEQGQLIRRYVPPAVANRIETGDASVDTPQRRRITVFFSDIVGFTTLADQLDPEALAEIVNEYLGGLVEIVERHGGTLNEFAGDGVMALFGAPDEMDPADQVLAALRAAQELQRSLPGWSSHWYRLGVTADVRARIGINTGVVSVGTFGSAVRATYTGIGLQTNIAARIQAECPPGSVLVSSTSWHLIKDEVPCTPYGEVEVKGVHFPIQMYAPSP